MVDTGAAMPVAGRPDAALDPPDRPRRAWRGPRRLRLIVPLAVAGVLMLAVGARVLLHDDPPLFHAAFEPGSGLVTNEYATYNPQDPASVRSEDWIVTSGSLFRRDGTAWSGVPDATEPDADSGTGTGSSVLRVVTRRDDFGDVRVSFDLQIHSLAAGVGSTNDWDGVHLFARYQSPDDLYVASLERRDGRVVIKKKRPGAAGGDGSTYVDLGPAVVHPLPPEVWNRVELDVRNGDGGVRLTLRLNGEVVQDVVDRGAAGDALTMAGRIGLRGDAADFSFRDFTIRR